MTGNGTRSISSEGFVGGFLLVGSVMSSGTGVRVLEFIYVTELTEKVR